MMTEVQNTLTFSAAQRQLGHAPDRDTVTVTEAAGRAAGRAQHPDAVNDAAVSGAHRPRRGGRRERRTEYDPVDNVNLAVSVSVTDDDTAGITVTAADPFTVGEGSSATYTVKLNSEPSADVVISLTVSGSSEVTVADTDGEMTGVQNTLTFTASNWDTSPDGHRQRGGGRRRGQRRRHPSPTPWWTAPAPTSTTRWPTWTWP